MPNIEVFLGKKKETSGPELHRGQTGKSSRRFQKVTAEIHERKDAGLIAHSVENFNVTGSYYCQPYFCTVRNQNLFLGAEVLL